ncbi:MAG: hypothetical protein IJ024_04810 [Lachnospiraceae bacterium]|nr:hypothetical protein [Lachnospiraceae bacterium]
MNKMKTEKNTYTKKGASRIRKLYIAKLVGRCIILCLCAFLCWKKIEEFDVIYDFFADFSMLHLLWIIWMIDMICQLVPVKDRIALGSQKLFEQRFKPIRDKINYQNLRNYIISTTKSAYKIFIIWALLIGALGVLYYKKIIGDVFLLMTSVVFYVCDLICVLIWCPFRLIMRNKCCTTCRIFNWDHLMMFTPLLYVGGFYTRSLLLMAIAVWLLWEVSVMLYPERFWEFSNEALKCSNCTDKLCTQYCQKLRRPKTL